MKSLILTLLLVIIVGCAPPKNNTDITAEDVASALQMEKWLIKMPEDSPSNKLLALKVIFKGEEKIITYGHADPGEVTKLLIWDDGNNRSHNFRWTNDNGGGHFGKLKHDAFNDSTISWHNTENICSVGDMILRGYTMSSDGDEYMVEICLKDK